MKNFLTKAVVCAGVLASAMALSSVAVFAETATFIVPDDSGKINDNITVDGITLVPKSGSSSYVSGEKEIGGEKFSCGVNFGGKTTSGGAYLKFDLTEDTDVKIYYISNKTQYIGVSDSITNDNTKYISSGKSVAASETGVAEFAVTDVPSDGKTYYICNSTDKYTVYAVKLTKHDSSVVRYSATVDNNAKTKEAYPDVSVSLDSETAPTKAIISWSANDSYTEGSANVSLTGKTASSENVYAIEWDDFSDEIDKCEIKAEEVITTPQTIDPTKIESGELGVGSLITDYFMVSKGKFSGTSNQNAEFGAVKYTKRFNTGGKDREIEFKTDGEAYIQIIFCSTSSTNATTVTVSSDVSGFTALSETNSSNSTLKSLEGKLPGAGTYKINCNSNTNYFAISVTPGEGLVKTENGYIFSDKTDAYAIATVTADEVSNSEAIYISTEKGNSNETNKNVYKTAVIDNTVINATALASDAEYLYAAKLTGAVTSNQLDSAKGFIRVLVTE